MIAVNKNLSNLNMYDTLAIMFNDGRNLYSVGANTKIGRFSTAYFTEFHSSNNNISGYTSLRRYCYGVKNDVTTLIFTQRYYNENTYYWSGIVDVNGGASHTFSGSLTSWYNDLGFSYRYTRDIMSVTMGSDTFTFNVNDYDYIYFTFSLNNCTDLIIFDESQNYFITNQFGVSLLNKINKELYNSNSSVSSLLTNYISFTTNLTNIKSYMLTNNMITVDENNAPFHSLVKPAIKYKFDKTNRMVKFYSRRPITVSPSFTHNGTDELYIVHIPKSLNSDSILTQFLNTTTNLPVNQFIVSKFKIGTPSNSDGCDIIIDYINRIDTIDEININVKLSNIIN